MANRHVNLLWCSRHPSVREYLQVVEANLPEDCRFCPSGCASEPQANSRLMCREVPKRGELRPTGKAGAWINRYVDQHAGVAANHCWHLRGVERVAWPCVALGVTASGKQDDCNHPSRALYSECVGKDSW